MGQMATLDKTGDSKIIWDADNPDEVAAAKAQFDSLTKKGFKAFAVKKSGDQGELIKAFDADAEKLILVPPIVGG